MAFQNVDLKSTKEPVKLTALKIGESVTGFVAAFQPSKQNPENMNILMKAEDGTGTFYVYTAGNVKYMITDGKIKQGLLTQITRLDDRKMKNGKTTSNYQVLQDPERTLDDASLDALLPPNGASLVDATVAAAARENSERNKVKAQAQKLSEAMKPGR